MASTTAGRSRYISEEMSLKIDHILDILTIIVPKDGQEISPMGEPLAQQRGGARQVRQSQESLQAQLTEAVVQYKVEEEGRQEAEQKLEDASIALTDNEEKLKLNLEAFRYNTERSKRETVRLEENCKRLQEEKGMSLSERDHIIEQLYEDAEKLCSQLDSNIQEAKKLRDQLIETQKRAEERARQADDLNIRQTKLAEKYRQESKQLKKERLDQERQHWQIEFTIKEKAQQTATQLVETREGIRDLERNAQEAVGENARLQGKLRTSFARNKDLEEALKTAAQSASELWEEHQQLTSELRHLAESLDVFGASEALQPLDLLRRGLKEKEAEAKKVEGLAARVQELEQENDSVVKEKNHEVKMLEGQKARIQQLEQDIESAAQEKEVEVTKVINLTAQVRKLEQEKDSVLQEKEVKATEVADLTAQIQKLLQEKQIAFKELKAKADNEREAAKEEERKLQALLHESKEEAEGLQKQLKAREVELKASQAAEQSVLQEKEVKVTEVADLLAQVQKLEQKKQSVAQEKRVEATKVASLTTQAKKFEQEKDRYNGLLALLIRQDTDNFQDLNEKRRPEVVIRRYQDVCNSERLDAADELEKRDLGGAECLKMCCEVMVESWERAQMILQNFMKNVLDVLEPEYFLHFQHPGSVGEGFRMVITNELQRKKPDAVTQEIIEGLKEHVKVDGRPLFMDHTKRDCQRYLEACAEVAWMIVLTSPPMALVTDTGGNFDNKKHTLYSECARDATKVTKCIWPGLRFDTNDLPEVKGTVITEIAQRRQ